MDQTFMVDKLISFCTLHFPINHKHLFNSLPFIHTIQYRDALNNLLLIKAIQKKKTTN